MTLDQQWHWGEGNKYAIEAVKAPEQTAEWLTPPGARTDAVSCGQPGCRVRHVADGPAVAHGEGHIAFVPQ